MQLFVLSKVTNNASGALRKLMLFLYFMKKPLHLLLVISMLIVIDTPVHLQQNKDLQIRISPLNIIDPLNGSCSTRYTETTQLQISFIV